MLLVTAVGEIEPRHIHPRFHHFGQRVMIGARRAPIVQMILVFFMANYPFLNPPIPAVRLQLSQISDGAHHLAGVAEFSLSYQETTWT